MAAVINNRTGKRKKKQDDNDDNDSLSHNKKPRVVWTPHIHAKFLDAVNLLGLHEAVPRKIVALMNVEGITREHVASHLQKYRLGKKKAIHQVHQADTVPSTMIHEPTQSQTSFIIHQSHTQIYSNMSGVAPSTLIQSQNINNPLNIHPLPSTYPVYHHTSTLFPTLVNQSTTPLGFATVSSSKSTSIWDYDWHQTEPHSLLFPHNSLPVLESHKTSQNSQMSSQLTEPFILGSAASLEDTNIKDYNFCYDNSPIEFSVEQTNCNTLEDVTNMWGSLEEEDLMNVWRCLEEEEDVTNVMQPSCYEAPQQPSVC